ncbi:hypothetical protein BH11GEM1_BH11GEM1_18480 [soil metagenome]
MFTYELDVPRRRVNVVVSGKTSSAELMTGLHEVLDDPRFDPTYAILVDLGSLQQTPTIAELRDIALAVRANSVGTGARRAMITSSAVFYELARLFARLTAGSASNYRAFRNRTDAEAWLGGTGPAENEEESDSPTV